MYKRCVTNQSICQSQRSSRDSLELLRHTSYDHEQPNQATAQREHQADGHQCLGTGKPHWGNTQLKIIYYAYLLYMTYVGINTVKS